MTSFDRVAEEYDATRGGEERGRRLAGLIDPWLHPGELVVEVGVGTGVIALGLTELGRAVVGFDLAPKMLARAKARIGPRVVAADAGLLPVKDGTVGNVCAVWIMHLLDRDATFAEMWRILRAGGRVAVIGAGESPRTDPIGLIRDRMFTALRGGAAGPDEPDRIRGTAEAQGFRFAGKATSHGWFEAIPNRFADQVERRGFSILFDLDEERWQTIVEPALAEVRALPDPDAPLRVELDSLVQVFEKPARA